MTVKDDARLPRSSVRVIEVHAKVAVAILRGCIFDNDLYTDVFIKLTLVM